MKPSSDRSILEESPSLTGIRELFLALQEELIVGRERKLDRLQLDLATGLPEKSYLHTACLRKTITEMLEHTLATEKGIRSLSLKVQTEGKDLQIEFAAENSEEVTVVKREAASPEGLIETLCTLRPFLDRLQGDIFHETSDNDQNRLCLRVPISTNVSAHPTEPDYEILLVEDEANVGELYLNYFQHFKCRSLLAQSMAEAEIIASRYSFAVAIVDLQLPDGDGCLLIERWKKSALIPFVIATSAAGNPDSEENSFRSGADRFLGKPFELSDIQNCLPPNLQRDRSEAAIGQFRTPSAQKLKNKTLRTKGEMALAQQDSSSFLKVTHHFTNESFALQFLAAARAFSDSEEATRADDWDSAARHWKRAWEQFEAEN